ncbi:hypothetical protein FQN60_003468, partial [Etheostoma spectabile]
MWREYLLDLTVKHQYLKTQRFKAGFPAAIVRVALMLLFLDPGVSDLRPTNFIQTVWPNPSPSWIQAQAFCRERNLDLVTIGSERENQLYVLNAGWMGEPKDPNNCAFKFANDPQWVSDLCGNKHSVMCSDETLVLVKENRTWEQALNHCRSLEALDSSQPATAYQNYRYDLASLLTLDDHWLWVGGELVQYPAIGSCPTHTACGVLKNGIPGFGTMDCTWKRNFICYKQQEWGALTKKKILPLMWISERHRQARWGMRVEVWVRWVEPKAGQVLPDWLSVDDYTVTQSTSDTSSGPSRAASQSTCRDPGSACVNGSSGCRSAVIQRDHQAAPGQLCVRVELLGSPVLAVIGRYLSSTQQWLQQGPGRHLLQRLGCFSEEFLSKRPAVSIANKPLQYDLHEEMMVFIQYHGLKAMINH